MKTFLLIAITAVVISSCSPVASFDSPNDVSYVTAILYLNDGKQLEGKLSVTDSWNGNIRLYLNGERKPQRFRFSDVRGYRIRNEYYELKEIRDGGSFSRNYRLHFMKRLTPEDSKINLYEDQDKQTYYGGYRRNLPMTTLDKNYYIELPNEKHNQVWDIGLTKLVPNFDEKMSEIVKDCPTLSQKIANKEKGYFYSQLGGSEEKRVDILWNIINEYNKCR